MSTSYSWEGKARYGYFQMRTERVGVQVKLQDPLRTRAIAEHFWDDDSWRGTISSVHTFTFWHGQSNQYCKKPLSSSLPSPPRYTDTPGEIRSPVAHSPFITGYTPVLVQSCSADMPITRLPPWKTQRNWAAPLRNPLRRGRGPVLLRESVRVQMSQNLPLP